MTVTGLSASQVGNWRWSCKEDILREIDSEIRHLKRYQKAQASIEADRAKLESLSRILPESPALDRLLDMKQASSVPSTAQ